MFVLCRRAMLWSGCVLLLGLSIAVSSEGQERPQAVQMTIDYGDGVQTTFTRLSWKAGMTVLGALQAAEKHPRGIKFTHQGSGETTLITSIGGLKNEGRGSNWLYEVSGKRGDRSAAIYELEAGDVVLWKFAPDR